MTPTLNLARTFVCPFRDASPTIICRLTRIIVNSQTGHSKRTYATSTNILSPQKFPPSKLFKDADIAVADIKSGSTLLSAGFGLCGVAGKLHHIQNVTLP